MILLEPLECMGASHRVKPGPYGENRLGASMGRSDESAEGCWLVPMDPVLGRGHVLCIDC